MCLPPLSEMLMADHTENDNPEGIELPITGNVCPYRHNGAENRK